ncbi:MAG: allantoate amidohydrolase [Frankiaceae bacterium]
MSDQGRPPLAATFRELFGALAAIGRDPRGGWSRFAWTAEDAAARAWFAAEAGRRGLAVEVDAAGNQWAWWLPASGEPAGRPAGAVVTGSHLDTVPGGGAYDGALGVVSALLAVDLLRAEGGEPRRPLAVVAFADEEGARFNLPTYGSKALSGQLDVDAALRRRDVAGVTLAEALAAASMPAPRRDDELLGRVAAFVELHVEQGRGLADLDAALAVATGIWPHGRWRLDARGEANHAGTTRMADRRDPAAVLAVAIESAREHAIELDAVATVGRVLVEPNGTNAVPSAVTAWLDARAVDDNALEQLVQGFESDVTEAGERYGVEVTLGQESFSPAVQFDPELAERVAGSLDRIGLPAVRLPTAAGHDAGTLAPIVPTAMLFVRNPTGVSHSPAESASDEDCVTGIRALAAVIEDLACR